MKPGLASSSRVRRRSQGLTNIYVHARTRRRGYYVRRLFSSSAPGCDSFLTLCASRDPTGLVPHLGSDWLVSVGLDNARISSRISASRSGGSGGMLIYVVDAAELKLCLLLRSFFAEEVTGAAHRIWSSCRFAVNRGRESKRKAGRQSPSS
jgi:hypothetical protein